MLWGYACTQAAQGSTARAELATSGDRERLRAKHSTVPCAPHTHLRSFCSKSSFWLMRRQLRLYQDREAGYASADRHRLPVHTCTQQQRQQER